MEFGLDSDPVICNSPYCDATLINAHATVTIGILVPQVMDWLAMPYIIHGSRIGEWLLHRYLCGNLLIRLPPFPEYICHFLRPFDERQKRGNVNQ